MPKRRHSFFTQKDDFNIAQKRHAIFWAAFAWNVLPRNLKIAQSGHTEGVSQAAMIWEYLKLESCQKQTHHQSTEDF